MARLWHCPGCSTILHHDESGVSPRAGERYRCHVCRLEVLYDETIQTIVGAPFDGDRSAGSRRPRMLTAHITDNQGGTKGRRH